jgi:pSer/pThr/pTyr-binding forkhead associated (FHA) protein
VLPRLLFYDADGLLLLGLQSTNGTFMNGVPLPPDQPLRLNDGDVIQLGQVLARYAALHTLTAGAFSNSLTTNARIDS